MIQTEPCVVIIGHRHCASDLDLAVQTITYSIVPVGSGGGADAARFQIDGSTGALSFITPPDFEIPTIEEHGTDEWLPWTEAMYSIKTHPREIVDNLADRGHFPAVHATDIHEFAFEVDGHISRQRVKGTAKLPGGGVDNFSSTTTYHGPGFLLMKMDGALQNYMLIAHTPNDTNTLDLRMGVMLKIVGSRARTEGYVAQYLSNLKAGFEDDIRIWETKLYRETPVLCDGDGPISQLRRWYRQFYVTGP